MMVYLEWSVESKSPQAHFGQSVGGEGGFFFPGRTLFGLLRAF